ncbi:MAG TPA: hypothetical protein VKV74_16575 [Bryobacteraceae bacterium]|nr:hypothetical protein [Bryobacteraceae bacterium]
MLKAMFLMGIAAAVAGAENPVLTLTGTADAAGTIKIDVLRWSSDEDRDRLISAWTQPAPAAPKPPQGRGGGRGGRAGARGGNPGEPAAPKTPESALAEALAAAPTIGYLWSSSEVSGYALRFAARYAEQDGSERIVLITDRPLGAWNDVWKSAALAGSPKYDFSLIELRLKPKAAGEGKTSLAGTIALDAAAKSFGLANYAAAPVTLKNLAPR